MSQSFKGSDHNSISRWAEPSRTVILAAMEEAEQLYEDQGNPFQQQHAHEESRCHLDFSHACRVAALLCKWLDAWDPFGQNTWPLVATALMHCATRRRDVVSSMQRLSKQFCEAGGVAEGPLATPEQRTALAKESLRLRQMNIHEYRKLPGSLEATVIHIADLHDQLEHPTISDGPHLPQARLTNYHALRSLCSQLGLWEERRNLEDLIFRLEAPQEYHEWEQARERFLQQEADCLEQTRDWLREQCQESLLSLKEDICGVRGFQRRMQQEHGWKVSPQARALTLPMHEAITFLLLAPDLATCFPLYGLVQACGQPWPQRWADNLSHPLENGYARLEVTITPNGPAYLPKAISLRIQTQMMYEVARLGVLSHAFGATWATSGGVQQGIVLDPEPASPSGDAQAEAACVRRLRESLVAAEKGKPIEAEDKIVAFTLTGKELWFRRGATLLDFAYRIHSEVGDQAVAANVGGKTTQNLCLPIPPGKHIEIIKGVGVHRTQQELERVTTPLAKRRIRKALQRNFHEQALESLRQWARGKKKPEPETAFEQLKMHHAALGYQSFTELLFDLRNHVQKGERNAFIDRLLHQIRRAAMQPSIPQVAAAIGPAGIQRLKERGATTTRLRFCKACQDFTKQQGASSTMPTLVGQVFPDHLLVHADRCPQLEPTQDLIPLEWTPVTARRRIQLFITSMDRHGLVHEICNVLERAIPKVNIIRSLHASTWSEGGAGVRLLLLWPQEENPIPLLQSLALINGVLQVRVAADDSGNLQGQTFREIGKEGLWHGGELTAPQRPERLNKVYNSRCPIPEGGSPFVGRETLLRECQSALLEEGKNLLIYGPWFAGKASLCNNLLREYPAAEQFRLIKLDVSPWRDLFNNETRLLASIAGHLLSRSTEKARQALEELEKLASFMEALESQKLDFSLKRFNDLMESVPDETTRRIIVLEHADSLVERCLDRFTPRQLHPDLLPRLLESAAQSKRWKVVLSISLATWLKLSQQTLFAPWPAGRPVEIRVEYLDRLNTERMICEPMYKQGIVYHPEAMQKLWELSGGCPYFVHLLQGHLIDDLNRLRSRTVVLAADVEAAARAALDHYLSRHFTNILKPFYHDESVDHLSIFMAAARAINKGRPLTWNGLIQETQEYLGQARRGNPPEKKTIEELFNEAEQWGVFVNREQGIHFFADLLQRRLLQ
jgi:(p)ppGpp synthase/HD superfamily hydrolase